MVGEWFDGDLDMEDDTSTSLMPRTVPRNRMISKKYHGVWVRNCVEAASCQQIFE